MSSKTNVVPFPHADPRHAVVKSLLEHDIEDPVFQVVIVLLRSELLAVGFAASLTAMGEMVNRMAS